MKKKIISQENGHKNSNVWTWGNEGKELRKMAIII